MDKLPDDLAEAIAKAEQNGAQDSATEKEEKEAEVVSPKVDKTENPAAQVDGKEAAVSEASSEKPAVPEEHTDTTNQDKPVANDKSKEEKASVSESSQATKEKEKEDQLLQERKQNFNKDWYFKWWYCLVS